MAQGSQLQDQLAGLHDAALAITAELSLDKVLQKIVDVARDLLGARYAALGVAGVDGSLVEFVTAGLTQEEVARIAERPSGRGLVGALLHARRPIRASNIAMHPSSVGFPEHHPPMTSFLGAPLLVRGKTVGSLYLTDKQGATEFTADDEVLIEMLAAQAAVAVANARLFAQSDEALRRKVAELHAERTNLKAILDQMPEGVIIVDAPNQDVVLMNRAAQKLLGVNTLQSGEPVPIHSLVPVGPLGDPTGPEESPICRAVRTEEIVSGEQMRLCRPDGSCITCLSNAAPLYDAKGNVTGGIVIFQDITALKELDRLKDELVSIISHELRNPLTAIRGRAQLMLRVARRNPERADEVTGLEAIDAQVEKLARMARELIDVSQMRLGLLELRCAPTDLVALARQSVEDLRAVDEHRTITLATTLDHLEGDWDGGRIEQVLHNLIENAKKYSSADKQITVSVAATTAQEVGILSKRPTARPGDESWALIAVTDEGIGIPVEAQKHLFDPFYRAPNAKGRAETGLGLGLYICNEIVSQHGGLIWVECEEGRGTTFKVALPLRSE